MLMSDRGPFYASAEVDELPNGNIFVGNLCIGFPEDACTQHEQDRFTELKGEEVRKILVQHWAVQNGRPPPDLTVVARGDSVFKV